MMVHTSSAENVFYSLISFLTNPARKDTAIFFYQPRFGFNDLPFSSQLFLPGQLRAEVTFFSHVCLPILDLNCLLLPPAVNIF